MTGHQWNAHKLRGYLNIDFEGFQLPNPAGGARPVLYGASPSELLRTIS